MPLRYILLGLPLFLIVVLTWSSPILAAGSLYVAPSGDDTRDCRTAATACQTIAAAIDKAADDDTILIASGTYTESLGIDKSLTLIGDGAPTTTVSGEPDERVLDVDGPITVTISGLTFANAAFSEESGGIYNGAYLTIHDSVMRHNASYAQGGGIRNDGTLVGSDLTITDNTGSSGGGLANFGVATLWNVTFDHNSSNTGGAIFNGNAITLTNVTISHNRGVLEGGGIANFGTASLTNVTIAGNGAATGGGVAALCCNSTISLKNSLLADNLAGDNCSSGSNAAITSLGHNLDSGHSCSFNKPGDIHDRNPKLGPLQSNGGKTFTHALRLGSPAIDMGDDAGCPAIDQRGVMRPQGPGCDIGAFEVEWNSFYLPLISNIVP